MTRRHTLAAHRRRRRPPFFAPVPLRTRRDGWTVERQCGFLALLYVTGAVGAAARGVGMSRASAYRLRARAGAEGFARAWDHVLTPPGSDIERSDRRVADFRKVTHEQLAQQVESGLVQPVLYRGVMRAVRKKADNSALLRLLRRADRLAARGERSSPAEPTGIFQAGVVSVTPDCAPDLPHGEASRTGPGLPAHGNGTGGAGGLTACAICGPSQQVASRGIA